MALFGRKKNIEKEKAVEARSEAPISVAHSASRTTSKTPASSSLPIRVSDSDKLSFDFSSVLLSPRITEKATLVGQKAPVYVFNVHKNATKDSVAKAVRDVYSVAPEKVRIAQIQPKNVFSRGRAGVKAGGKKAYVYLKEGDKIELV